jgi:hypothetical protein
VAPEVLAMLMLPDIKAGAILIDPPLAFTTWSRKGEGRSPKQHYGCMSFDELAAIQLASVATPLDSAALSVSGQTTDGGVGIYLQRRWLQLGQIESSQSNLVYGRRLRDTAQHRGVLAWSQRTPTAQVEGRT